MIPPMFNLLLAILSFLCPGDANGDNVVNILDLSVEAAHLWQTVEPGTNGDVTGDGVVTIADITLTGAHYGNICLVVPGVSQD